MSSGRNLLSQCRKPTGWFGRFTLWTMNIRHSKVTDWGLARVSIAKNATILDVGCGGGRTIQKLAAIATAGKVYGVDYSEASVAAAERTNARTINAGRVEIRESSVSHLPFPDNTLDLVTGVETHFFWPDLPNDMREVLRVLKPGGKLILISEIYQGGKHDRRVQMLERYAEITRMTILSVDGDRELFSKAGYSDVEVIDDYAKGWICAMGKKPT